jgi:hypothetical protein
LLDKSEYLFIECHGWIWIGTWEMLDTRVLLRELLQLVTRMQTISSNSWTRKSVRWIRHLLLDWTVLRTRATWDRSFALPSVRACTVSLFQSAEPPD